MEANDHLHVCIAFSGWIEDSDDIVRPWTVLRKPGRDLFAIECETQAFQDLGMAMVDFLGSAALGYATGEVLKTTALATAVAALSWPLALLQMSTLIDNRTMPYLTNC